MRLEKTYSKCEEEKSCFDKGQKESKKEVERKKERCELKKTRERMK